MEPLELAQKGKILQTSGRHSSKAPGEGGFKEMIVP